MLAGNRRPRTFPRDSEHSGTVTGRQVFLIPPLLQDGHREAGLPDPPPHSRTAMGQAGAGRGRPSQFSTLPLTGKGPISLGLLSPVVPHGFAKPGLNFPMSNYLNQVPSQASSLGNREFGVRGYSLFIRKEMPAHSFIKMLGMGWHKLPVHSHTSLT